jgi:NAD(P)-dependent dehydrogenase (short-subunit alcohol dehydrogenase family)
MATAIVIGAHPSGNIGGETARLLINEGWQVRMPSEDDLDITYVEEVNLYDWNADALVISAGHCEPDWFWRMDPQSVQNQIDINLSGPLRCVQAYLEAMFTVQANPVLTYKRVVIVGSRAAETPHRGQVPYNASKAGLRAAVSTLAREVHSHGFRVFLIEPGAVDGTNYGRRVEEGAERMGLSDRAGAVRGTFGKNLAPLEVARFIVMLLRPGGPDRLAGAPIPFGGGPQ